MVTLQKHRPCCTSNTIAPVYAKRKKVKSCFLRYVRAVCISARMSVCLCVYVCVHVWDLEVRYLGMSHHGSMFPFKLSRSCWLTFSLPVRFPSYTRCSLRSQISQSRLAAPCICKERCILSLVRILTQSTFWCV